MKFVFISARRCQRVRNVHYKMSYNHFVWYFEINAHNFLLMCVFEILSIWITNGMKFVNGWEKGAHEKMAIATRSHTLSLKQKTKNNRRTKVRKNTKRKKQLSQFRLSKIVQACTFIVHSRPPNTAAFFNNLLPTI